VKLIIPPFGGGIISKVMNRVLGQLSFGSGTHNTQYDFEGIQFEMGFAVQGNAPIQKTFKR